MQCLEIEPVFLTIFQFLEKLDLDLPCLLLVSKHIHALTLRAIPGLCALRINFSRRPSAWFWYELARTATEIRSLEIEGRCPEKLLNTVLPLCASRLRGLAVRAALPVQPQDINWPLQSCFPAWRGFGCLTRLSLSYAHCAGLVRRPGVGALDTLEHLSVEHLAIYPLSHSLGLCPLACAKQPVSCFWDCRCQGPYRQLLLELGAGWPRLRSVTLGALQPQKGLDAFGTVFHDLYANCSKLEEFRFQCRTGANAEILEFAEAFGYRMPRDLLFTLAERSHWLRCSLKSGLLE